MERVSASKTKKDLGKAAFQAAAILLGLLVLFPVIYCFFVSFMMPNQVQSIPPTIFPKEWTLDNYWNVMETTTIGRFMLNSLILAGASSVIRLITASFAAFAFAFYEFKGRNLLFMLCLGTVMIPSDVVLVTNYQTISQLGLVNTYIGMMSVFCVSAMNIFMMRQNFLTFSKTLQEAAYVDGCSNIRFFFKILLPTSTPVLTTVFISSFISTWNTYLWPMLVTNNPLMRTVQVGVTMLNNEDGNVYGPIMAASMMVLVPTAMIFLIFRKKIVSGMMGGAIKG
ncbi:MAG: carbohydrate ABC transporter permease [Oscillospiraceae bacterium]|jgi:sn-glycerol 3-phosphate transport system permease protein|nr:carbohydrate ABC transporter permease [Oscillospiraceae bacterium]